VATNFTLKSLSFWDGALMTTIHYTTFNSIWTYTLQVPPRAVHAAPPALPRVVRPAAPQPHRPRMRPAQLARRLQPRARAALPAAGGDQHAPPRGAPPVRVRVRGGQRAEAAGPAGQGAARSEWSGSWCRRGWWWSGKRCGCWRWSERRGGGGSGSGSWWSGCGCGCWRGRGCRRTTHAATAAAASAVRR
jgi:hypothetical protein